MRRPDFDYPGSGRMPPPLLSVPPDPPRDRPLRAVIWFCAGAVSTLAALVMTGALP